jgi:hypothetical protein
MTSVFSGNWSNPGGELLMLAAAEVREEEAAAI